MKTAISMPDDTFHRVTRCAQDLGLSRSDFLTRAAVAYLDVFDNRSLVIEIDSALHNIGGTDESAEAAVAAGHRLLRDVDSAW